MRMRSLPLFRQLYVLGRLPSSGDRRNLMAGRCQLRPRTAMVISGCAGKPVLGVAICVHLLCGDSSAEEAQGADADEDSDDAPVVVDASELGAGVREVEDPTNARVAHASEPATMSWRDKAILLRQQRQAAV